MNNNKAKLIFVTASIGIILFSLASSQVNIMSQPFILVCFVFVSMFFVLYILMFL